MSHDFGAKNNTKNRELRYFSFFQVKDGTFLYEKEF